MIAAIGAAVNSHNRRKRMATPSYRQPTVSSRPMLDLAALASVTVPAHGLIVNSRGVTSAGKIGSAVSTFAPWLRRLFGAVAIASMIALGLFVYTEFVGAWQRRGLPSIPISALSAIGEHAQNLGDPQAQPRGQPASSSQRQQKLELLNDYVG